MASVDASNVYGKEMKETFTVLKDAESEVIEALSDLTGKFFGLTTAYQDR